MTGQKISGQEAAGRSVLIVEDEPMIAMLIEDILGILGCAIAGVALRFEDAVDKASSLSFDVAILDINLNGHQSYPLAEILRAREIPFVFASGYDKDSLPQALHGVPFLSKPFTLRDLQQALQAALAVDAGQ
jgi:CheY-like chemotaxis protein